MALFCCLSCISFRIPNSWQRDSGGKATECKHFFTNACDVASQKFGIDGKYQNETKKIQNEYSTEFNRQNIATKRTIIPNNLREKRTIPNEISKIACVRPKTNDCNK